MEIRSDLIHLGTEAKARAAAGAEGRGAMSGRHKLVVGIAIAVGLVLLIRLILAGYPVDWTGFKYTQPMAGDEQARTLWDWLDLLVVSAVIAGGGYWLNQQRNRTEDRIALERQRENALQKYYDNMSDLLLKHKLKESERFDVARDVAQARTLAVLRGLDENRKGML